jgi:hypothetical protein
MSETFDFISATDKPALLAISTPEWTAVAEAALQELGYKVQKISTHLEFPSRFSQVRYQVVVVEDRFCSGSLVENLTLQTLQHMPMNQRRHAAVILIGDSFETLNALQAFQFSVHAVINYSEMGIFGQLVKKTVGDNDLFLENYREIEQRVAKSRQ